MKNLRHQILEATSDVHQYQLPAFSRVQLAGGLRVILCENHTIPLVQLHAAVLAGAYFDPAGKEGSASLLASALKEGTAKRSATQMYQAAEDLGADIVSWADWETSAVVIELLSSDLPFAVELLFEILNSPALPVKTVEDLRRRQLSHLSAESSDPAELANYWFAHALYGETRYGHPLQGSRASLQRIDRETLIDFHGAHSGLPNLVIIASGSFNAEELVLRIESAASACSRGEPVAVPSIEPLPHRDMKMYVLDIPHASQTEMRLGHLGVARDHPEFVSLQIMSAILDRRLKQKLREEHGYTYHLRCRFISRKCAGPFSITTAVNNEHVGSVISKIKCEMEQLQQVPVSQHELSAAQHYLTGVYLRSLQPGHELISQLKLLASRDLPDDHFLRYLEKLRHCDSDDIARLAQRHLHPNRMIVVAAGPARSFYHQLGGCAQLVEPAQIRSR